MIRGMLRAAWLDAPFFEQVEADRTATSQARWAVILVGLLFGTGAGLRSAGGELGPSAGTSLALSAAAGIAAAIAGWLAWSFITYWIGTRWTAGPATEADVGQLLRTLGFASAPLALGALAWVPQVGGAFLVAGAVWALFSATVAVRQALDFSTARAILTVLLGWVVHVAALGLLLAWGYFTAAPVR